MIILENKYNIGDVVYLKTDPDQFERIVIAFCWTPDRITYGLMCGTESTYHYDYEITVVKNEVIKNG